MSGDGETIQPLRKRRLIVVIDGTGNTAISAKRNAFSNAYRVCTALRNKDAGQIVFYFPGPGTRRVPFGWFNRLTGSETKEIVTEAYLALCNNVSDDGQDELYFFGYSRGAIAVKMLAEIVCDFGLLDPRHFYKVDKIWKEYKQPGGNRASLVNYTREMDVEFIGLFDPVHGPRTHFLNLPTKKKLNPKINKAVEILAIDEGRVFFRPNLWFEIKDPKVQSVVQDLTGTGTRRLQQIWMPGGHSDIGDRSGKGIVADISFLTMMERIRHLTDLKVDSYFTNEAFNKIVNSDDKIWIHCRRIPFTFKRRSVPRNPSTEVHPLFDYIIGGDVVSYVHSWVYSAQAKVSMDDFQRSAYVFDLSDVVSTPIADPKQAIKKAIREAVEK